MTISVNLPPVFQILFIRFRTIQSPQSQTDVVYRFESCTMQAPGRSALLIPYLILALYILFACLYRMLLHLLVCSFFTYLSELLCLQCFDAVGWVAGRATGL